MSRDPLNARRRALGVALLYVIVAGCWILFSDEALKWLISDPKERTTLSIVKGWGFVVVTGGLLYSMLRRWLKELAQGTEKLIQSEAARQEAWKKQCESEEQLRYLNDNLSNTMVYQVRIERDGGRRFSYVSEAVRTLHGCSPEQAVADPTCIYGSVFEEDRQRLQREEELAIASLATFRTELRFQNSSGEVRWSQIVSQPRKLEDGAVLWNGIEIDITDRKRAETVLRASEERYHRLFELESDAIVLADSRTRQILDVNQSAQRLYGYSREEFIQLKLEDVSAEPEQTRLSADSGDTHVSAHWHRRKNGERFAVEINTRVIEFEGRQAKLAAVRDITERKVAEQALQESEERYRRLFEVESDSVLLVDRETGQFIDANPSALKLYGYTRREFLSLKHSDVSAEPEKTSHAIAEGQTFVANRKHRKKDGTVFPVQISGNYFDSKGRKLHVAAIRDLTDQKQAEEVLRKNDLELNRAQAIAHVGSWSWDCQTGVVTWSPEAYRIYGVTLETFDQTFSGLTRLVHPDDLPRLLKAHEAHAQGRAFEPYDFRVIRPNGDIRVVQIFSAEIERNAAGQPVRVFGALQDVTERRLAEQSLRVREEQLRLYAEHSPVAVAMFDRDMKYLVVSRRWLEDFRLGNQSLIGRSHYEVFPEIPQRWVEIHQRCLAGAVEKCEEEEFPRADGKTDWIRWEIRPWHQADDSIGGIIIFSEDITERKRAEAALRESESKLRGVFECSRDAIGIVSRGSHVFSNPAFLRLFGVSTVEQIVGKSVLDGIAPSHRQQMLEYMKRRAAGESLPAVYETRGLKANGEEFDMEVSGSTYQFHGETYTIAMIRDISDRKKAEGELRKSQGRLVAAVEAAGLRLYEEEGDEKINRRMTFFDHGMRELLGVPPDQEYRARDYWLEHIHPEDLRNIMTATIRQFEEEGQDIVSAEYRYLHVSRGEIWLRHAAHALERNGKGGVLRLVGAIQDITDRKRTEESHTKLATVVEQAAETIVMTDTKGTILYANPAFEKSTGYTRAEAVGQNSRVLKSGKQGDEFYRKMWETLERGEVWQGRFINRHKNGTLYDEDATISPVRDISGKIIGYVAVKRDVTRELQLERQFLQAQKMESVGQLAGGVAHNFNNMLAATMMHLSLLQLNSTLTPETQETIKELIEEAERAASLTRQLLMFSRRSVMEVKSLDLNETVANLLKMLGRLIGEHIVVRFERRGELPDLEGDPGMIEQVIMNLVVNARDAMPAGGELNIGIQAIMADSERVQAKPEVQPGRFLCLSVADNGCGMDEATRQRIFEPFFTTKEQGKGTGLGLATVHGIVAQHRGWVEVESELRKGTTFKVFLPASTKIKSREPTPLKTAAMRGHETILVVEDEVNLRRLLSRSLRLMGYAVFEAENGRAAMDLWQQRGGQFDLLFSDMVMPEGQTGLDLAEKMRKEKPNLKVIITSGHSAEVAGHSRLDARGIIYLQKPYRTELLSKVVRDCLDGKS